MDANFWKARWEAGQIGFHEGRPNRYLERYVGRLGTRRRVLAPLAGKAHDLAFLAELGHEVIGVELSEFAARAFFGPCKPREIEGLHPADRIWRSFSCRRCEAITRAAVPSLSCCRVTLVTEIRCFLELSKGKDQRGLPNVVRFCHYRHVFRLIPR